MTKNKDVATQINQEPAYKPIRFRRPYWQEIKDFADELAAERGVEKQDLPKVVMEAIKFMRENRKKVGQ